METLEQIKPVEFTGFEDEPIIERHSHMYGSLMLFAPLGLIEALPDGSVRVNTHLPWLFRTLYGTGGSESLGLKHVIRTEAIDTCLNHTPLISKRDLWADPDAEAV